MNENERVLEDLITSSEAAALANCHRSTIERQVKAGKLPGRVVGRTVLTLRSALVGPPVDTQEVEDAAA